MSPLRGLVRGRNSDMNRAHLLGLACLAATVGITLGIWHFLSRGQDRVDSGGRRGQRPPVAGFPAVVPPKRSLAPVDPPPAPARGRSGTGEAPHESTSVHASAEPVAPVSAHAATPPPGSLAQLESLQALLPTWMVEDIADLRSEKIHVVNAWVSRSRGRYEWENGSGIEVEITDLGGEFPEHLPKSLGFNPDMATDRAESGFTLATALTDCLVNQEYDHEAGEGMIQLLLRNRLLVEIKLQQLPLESFVAILEHQVPVSDLVALADKLSATAED